MPGIVIAGRREEQSVNVSAGAVTRVVDFDFADRSTPSYDVVARSSYVAATVTTPSSAAESVLFVARSRWSHVVLVAFLVIVLVLRRTSS